MIEVGKSGGSQTPLPAVVVESSPTAIERRRGTMIAEFEVMCNEIAEVLSPEQRTRWKELNDFSFSL